ncbi:MAG: ATP-grasp domain-containing protein [Paracoccaceae bacterium]
MTPVAPAFPRIVKPRGGSSSVGLRLADDPAAFSNLTLGPDDIVQHRVDGPEFTVNIFVDAQGRLGAAVPHLRIETRGGEVSKGRTARHPVFREIAERMVAALPGAAGALCFQARWPEGGLPQVFEINARFGGGYPLARAAGAPFSRWLLEEAAGLPATVADDWRDGTLMLRHDAAVFA